MHNDDTTIFFKENKRLVFGLDKLLVFCMGYFRERGSTIRPIDKRKLCRTLGIVRQTLNRNLLALRIKGMITEGDGLCNHVLSQSGKREYGQLYDAVDEKRLIPELHKGEGRLGDVIASLRDPENILRVVYNVMNGMGINVISIFHEEQVWGINSKERLLIKELSEQDTVLDLPFDRMSDEFTLTGKDGDDIREVQGSKTILGQTLTAHVFMRRFEYARAFELFSDIVRERSGEGSAYRVFSMVGMVQCMDSMNREKEALVMLEEFIVNVRAPVHRVMLMKCKADILSYDRFDESISLYNSCLKSLNNLKNPILETGVLNNMGVSYMNEKNYPEAERCWSKVLRISKDHNLPWIGAVAKVNISDPMALTGRIEKAKRILSEARRFFDDVDDREGMAGYYFNRALVYIKEGRPDMALRHFRLFEEFPLTYLKRKEERRRIMNERFIDKGWDVPFPRK